MMHNWFGCSIRYEKTMENGMQKKVTERYLVDALSFTEAEARIIEEITPFISGEFTVADIKRANYSRPLVQMQARLHHAGREDRRGKEDTNASAGTGRRPARRREEAGRRHEGHHGRLRDSRRGRNTYHGCIFILCRRRRKPRTP